MFLKIFNWNVNGIRSILKKDIYKNQKIYEYTNTFDILAFQEIKVCINVFENFHDFKYQYINGNCNGRGGTAILTKIKPIKVVYDLNLLKISGRCIHLEFKEFHFITVYQVNSGSNLKTLDNRIEWDTEFYKYLKKLKNKKVIISGDFNVVYNKEGTWNFDKQYNKIAGVTKIEMDNFKKLQTIIPIIPPKISGYTYFSYRFPKFKSLNKGMTLDYIMSNIKGTTTILNEIVGSDHLPIVFKFKIN
jgi:exodeoxyribonuclease-3